MGVTFWIFVGFVGAWLLLELRVLIINNREKERIVRERLAQQRRDYERQWDKLERSIEDLAAPLNTPAPSISPDIPKRDASGGKRGVN